MHITLTDEASAALSKRLGAEPGTLRIVYDTEGCGCAVNGVPALWIVDSPLDGDVSVASGPVDVWIDPNQAIFFEDAVKLDYRPDAHCFRLYSDSQIYHAALNVSDRRAASAKRGYYL